MHDIVKLSIEDLKQKAENLISDSISESTKKSYVHDWTVFANWCIDYKIDFFPATTETVGLFLTSMDGQRAISTIKRYLSSISQIHKMAGFESPTTNDYIRRILKGLSKKNTNEVCKASPIGWKLLKRMIDNSGISAIGQRNSTMLLIGWTCALRRSEIVSIQVEDIEFVEEGMILTIRESKTDQEHKGQILGVPFGKVERYCPVHKLKKWLKISKTTEGYVFRRLKRDANGLWTKRRENIHLEDRTVSIVIKKTIKRLGGNPSNFSGHSLRRGFATEAASQGIPAEILKRHTRHKSIQSLDGYIDRGSLFLDNPLSEIFRNSVSRSD